MEFKSVADSIWGQNGDVAAREEKPREKVVIVATPPASRRDNSRFTLGESRPNRRFFRPTLGCRGFRPFSFFIYLKVYDYKAVPSLNITRVSGEPDGRLSGSRPLFTGRTSLWSLQSTTVTRLQMSVGKRPGVNALLMTLSRVTLVSFIKPGTITPSPHGIRERCWDSTKRISILPNGV